jgi:hypothetical protein
MPLVFLAGIQFPRRISYLYQIAPQQRQVRLSLTPKRSLAQPPQQTISHLQANENRLNTICGAPDGISLQPLTQLDLPGPPREA